MPGLPRRQRHCRLVLRPVLDIVGPDHGDTATGAASRLLTTCEIGVAVDVDSIGDLVQKLVVVNKPMVSSQVPDHPLKFVV